eukprot:1576617-Lingulodinium_polyedra.AAC.1
MSWAATFPRERAKARGSSVPCDQHGQAGPGRSSEEHFGLAARARDKQPKSRSNSVGVTPHTR